MTEKKTDSAARMDLLPPLTMLLMRAARIAGFDAANGWPDALTFNELAALQYPEEGSASGCGMGPSYKSLKQLDFWELLNAFEKRGDVQAVKVDRPMPVQVLDGGPLAKWPCDAIERPAAVTFLKSIHEEPGEFVREWLGSEWQPTQAPESAAEPSKLEARKETIRAILAAIKELDPEFSHFAMPGQKADFFALCQEHDPLAFKYVRQSTFNDYLSGLCKFRQGARPTNYYREISPRIGVKRIKSA